MAEQVSRISIEINTGDSEKRLKALKSQMAQLESSGVKMASGLKGLPVADSLKSIANALTNMGVRSNSAGNDMGKLQKELLQAHAKSDRLAKSLEKSNTQLAKLGKAFAESKAKTDKFADGLKKANAKIDEMTKKAQKAEKEVQKAKSAMGGFGAIGDKLKGLAGITVFGMGVSDILQTADNMKTLDTQIKLVTKSEQEHAAVKANLSQIANKTRQDIASTIESYTNNARSLGQLGKNQAEVLKFTENISLAMAVGGKSATEQSAALLQLGQAMQSGVLQGDEFRSIAENSPILLDLIAEKLGKTRGEVKKLASDGKITAEVIYQSVIGAGDKLNEQFAQMPPTMNQALTLVNNRYQQFVDDFINKTGGMGEQIAKALVWASDNFRTLVTTISGLSAVYGAYMALNSTFVTTTIPAKIAALSASTRAFYAESVAINASTIAKARNDGVVKSLTASLAATRLGQFTSSVAGVTTELGKGAGRMASYAKEAAKTHGALGALRLGVVNATTAIFNKNRAIGILNATKGVLIGTAGRLGGVMTTLGRAILGVGTIIKAHPIMFIAGVISAIVVRTMGWEKAMESLSDAFNITKMALGDLLDFAIDGFVNALDGALNFLNGFLGSSESTTTSVGGYFGDLFAGTQGGFVGIMEVAARAYDQMAAFAVTSCQAVGNAFNNLGVGIANVFKGIINFGASVFEVGINETIIKPMNLAISAFNFVANKLGKEGIPLAQAVSVGRLAYGSFTHFDFGKNMGLNNTHSAEQGMINYIMENDTKKYQGGANGGLGQVGTSATAAANALDDLKESANKGKGKNSKDKKGKGDDEKYTYTPEELKALQKVQGLIYGSDLKKIAEQNGVPVHLLAGLMMQESRGEQYAKSHTGALGYFQTTSGYRKDMGLSEKDSYDLIKSGTAAINFLKQSYQEFGDWESAIRSYNAGRGGARQFNRTGKVSGNNARNKEVAEFPTLVGRFSAYYNNGKNELGKKGNVAQQSYEFTEQQLKAQNEQLKAQQELIKKYGDWYSRQMAQTESDIKAINDAFGEGSEQAKSLIDEVQTRFDISVDLRLKERNLELYGYTKTAQERMALEYEIHQLKINLNDELTEHEKNVYQQAAKDKYEHDLAMYKRLQDDKIKEIEKPIKDAQKEQEAIMTARWNQKTMRPDDFKRWQLEQEIATAKQTAKDAFNDKADAINKQDSDGNYEIADHEQRYRLIEEAKRLHNMNMENIDAEYAEKSKALNQELLDGKLASYGSAFGAFADLFKNISGEQSKSYRAMFAMSQAFSIAQIGVKMGNAMADAWNDPTATTIWQKMSNAARVAIEQGHLVSMVSAISPKGFRTGGYTGNGGVNDVAGVVHGKEYVLNANATKRIGVGNLDRLNKGDGIGGETKIIINNYTDEKAEVQKQPNGDIMVQIGMMKQIGRAEAQQVVREELSQGGLISRRLK